MIALRFIGIVHRMRHLRLKVTWFPVVAVLFIACDSDGIPNPIVETVSPSTHVSGETETLRIEGEHFLARVTRRLDNGKEFAKHNTFGVTLQDMDHPDNPTIVLTDIVYVSPKLLYGTVPDDVAPGSYQLAIITPYNKIGVAEEPFSVTAVPENAPDPEGSDTTSWTGGDADSDSDTDFGDTSLDGDTDSVTDADGTDDTDDTETAVQVSKTDVADFADSAIKVDGYLSERPWALQTPVEHVLVGTREDTVMFDLLWNNQYLYIGIVIHDDVLRNDSFEPWMDDSVDLVFDANHDRTTDFDNNDDHCIKAYNDFSLYCQSSKTHDVLHDWKPLPSNAGWSAEIAVPWSHFGVLPYEGMVFGFDIGVNDDDGRGRDSNRDNQLRWNGATDDWWTPSNFGEITLVNEREVSSDTAD
jgi:hypothetical protein